MIELWDNYVIDADAFQFILGKPSTSIDKRTGRVRGALDSATYHKTMGQALLTFHGIQLRNGIESESHTLESAIALSKQIEERILGLSTEPKVILTKEYTYT